MSSFLFPDRVAICIANRQYILEIQSGIATALPIERLGCQINHSYGISVCVINTARGECMLIDTGVNKYEPRRFGIIDLTTKGHFVTDAIVKCSFMVGSKEHFTMASVTKWQYASIDPHGSRITHLLLTGNIREMECNSMAISLMTERIEFCKQNPPNLRLLSGPLIYDPNQSINPLIVHSPGITPVNYLIHRDDQAMISDTLDVFRQNVIPETRPVVTRSFPNIGKIRTGPGEYPIIPSTDTFWSISPEERNRITQERVHAMTYPSVELPQLESNAIYNQFHRIESPLNCQYWMYTCIDRDTDERKLTTFMIDQNGLLTHGPKYEFVAKNKEILGTRLYIFLPGNEVAISDGDTLILYNPIMGCIRPVTEIRINPTDYSSRLTLTIQVSMICSLQSDILMWESLTLISEILPLPLMRIITSYAVSLNSKPYLLHKI